LNFEGDEFQLTVNVYNVINKYEAITISACFDITQTRTAVKRMAVAKYCPAVHRTMYEVQNYS